MKSFISAIYVNTSSFSEEKLCVGLFAGDTDDPHFAFSESKINNSGCLINKEIRTEVIKLLRSIQTDISLKGVNSFKLTLEYFNHLSRSHHGLLGFMEPKCISGKLSSADFETLYEHYVGVQFPKKREPKTTFHGLLKSYYDKPVFKEKADRSFVLNNMILPTIYNPHKVDLISRNGSVFVGHGIDLNTSVPTIEKHLYAFRALVDGLKVFSNAHNIDPNGDFKIYHNEPEDKEVKLLLDKVRKDETKGFSLHDVEEVNNDARKLELGNYIKFSTLL